MGAQRTHLLLSRRVVQVGMLAAFWATANLGIGVLSGTLSASRVLETIPLADPLALLQMLLAGHVPGQAVFLGAAIVLLAYGLLFGRAFCSWVCPVNLISDAAAALNRHFRLGTLLRLSRHTRIWILGLTLLLSAILGVAAFEWISPIGLAVRGIAYGSIGGLGALAALFLFDLFILPHGFCGHLCPLGAFWSLVTVKARLRVHIEPERCTHCMQCQTICPERQVISPLLQPQPALIVTAGACTRCGRCVEVCEPRALRLTVFNSAPISSKETRHEAA